MQIFNEQVHFLRAMWEKIRISIGYTVGFGAEPAGRRKIFENFQKIPEENCKNCCIFA